MIAELRFYLKLLPRRLPMMILLFLIVAIASVIFAFRMPAVYTSSAALLVEAAQIEEGGGYRDPNQLSSAQEQLQVVQQRLLTRGNLIDIANDLQVFPEQQTMTPDEIVNEMREASNIQLSIGQNQATLMRLTFTAGDPQHAAEVVNRYVDIALDISSTALSSQARDTAAFYQQEVEKYSDELDAQSGLIAQFKRENADALPENLEYNQTRQSLLQERVSRSERELDSLATQRTNILRVFEATGSIDTEVPATLTAEEQLLMDLESELSVALSVFSPTNPRVQALQSQVTSLRARLVEVAEEPQNALPAPPTAQRTALEISLAEIDSRMGTLRQEIASSNEELLDLRENIQLIPANRILLSGLEREQENIQDLYNAAVGRLAQARTSLNIVTASKGERVTVLEAAAVPTTPSSPSRTKIAAVGIAAGMGLAGGFFLLLEFLNQTVRRPQDIVKHLEITPLATIPRIETIGQKRLRRGLQITASLFVLTSVPAVLWAVDTYFMPLDLLFEKVKDRLI